MPLSNELWNKPPSGGTATPTQLGIMFAGYAGSYPSGSYSGLSNLVSSSGVVASDTSAVGTGRNGAAGAGYGEDKAIFGFGQGNCLYYPTCSEIIVNSIENKGLLSSFRTILKRIYICNPIYEKFGKNWQY